MNTVWTRALVFSAATVVLGLLTVCCHDGGSGPATTKWQFTGGIIFELNGGSRANGICVIDPNEVNPTTHPILPGASEPRVSPDGKKILQSRLAGNTLDLFVSNPDGTDARNLTKTDQMVSESDGDWAPGMQHVVCHALFYPTYREAIRVVSLDGTAAYSITDTNRVRTANLPRWSPDGTRIATVVQDSLYQPPQLSVISSDGGSERRYGETTLLAPSWSPGGGKLAYAAGDIRLRVLDLGSSQIVGLGADALAGPGVIWLGEDRLVYASIEGGLYGVKSAILSPSLDVRTLATGFNTLVGLVISPKKDLLAVFGRRDGEAALSLYLMALDGSNLRRISTVDPSTVASVSRNGYVRWVE